MVVVYSIRALKATNKMMLSMSESTVVRYRLRSRLRNLSASSPSNPNTRRISGLVCRLSGTTSWISPLSEMNRQVVPLAALWGRGASEIRERLHAAPTIQAGFALLEQLLLARLCEAPYRLGVVHHAITAIDQHHGALSIRALSDQMGISQNYLGAQFKHFVGVPPKEVARFSRFAHALRLIDITQPVDLTWIAHQAQFYDQSHFNKDFVAFTGLSPSEYVQLRRRVAAENPDYLRVLPMNLPIG